MEGPRSQPLLGEREEVEIWADVGHRRVHNGAGGQLGVMSWILLA